MYLLQLYNEAQEICCQVYGEVSLLASRLYINIGIVYEDNEDFVKAFDFFKKWANVSEKVLGPDHPKTLRAKGVLKEPRYRLVAQRLKDMEDPQQGGLTEESINREAKDVTDRGQENRDLDEALGGEEEVVDNVVRVTEDLQQAINELLQRALGEVDVRQAVLQNILNSFQASSRRLPSGSSTSPTSIADVLFGEDTDEVLSMEDEEMEPDDDDDDVDL